MTTPALTPLTSENFADFGWVLRRDPAGELFQVLHTEESSEGWRFACLAVPSGPLKRLHYHPDSEEIFIPVGPAPYIAVATPENHGDIHLFQLTEPVCVRRGVWHELIASEATQVFITENKLISGHARHFPEGLFEPPK